MANNRRAGHDAERQVAKWLRDNGWPDACTTRSKLGSDGTKQVGDVDVCDGTGLVVEVKRVNSRSAWPTWIAQTREQAGDRPWVLVRKTPGVASPARWVAAVDDELRCHAQKVPVFAATADTALAHAEEWLTSEPTVRWVSGHVIFARFDAAMALHRREMAA